MRCCGANKICMCSVLEVERENARREEDNG